MTKIVIVYHSGYGHTAKVANSVYEGIKTVSGVNVDMVNVDTLNEEQWTKLDVADGIIFGCPTYMGGASAKFKDFIDQASKRWMKQQWKDKIGAGFTNSGSYSGDKLNTLFQLVVNAMQHSMIWVGTGIMAPNAAGVEGPDSNQINRVGSFLGLATQSNNESPEISPPKGDLETGRLFGQRVANITKRFAGN